MLEKDGDQWDKLCEILGSITQCQGRDEYPTYNKKKEG